MALNTISVDKVKDTGVQDIILRQQFMTLFNSGDIAGSQNLITNNVQLFDSVVTPALMEKFKVGIMTLEDYYNQDVTVFLNTLLTYFQNKINNIKGMGAYASTTQYYQGNFVHYDYQVYLCKKECKNVLPTNQTYWTLIGLRGTVGSFGIGVNFNGSWDSKKPYLAKDMVSLNNNLYVAIRNNTGKNPTSSPADWLDSLATSNRKILTGTNPPIDIATGDIFWQYLT